jgi:hypothetical protein
MSMTEKLPDIPFSLFVNMSVVGHFIFAVPAISSILFIKVMDVTTSLCVFFPIIILSIFISATFTWLIAKGSNWENTPIAIKTLCALPSIYGGLFGGVIGSHFFGTLGSLLLAIVFVFIAFVVAIPLSKHFYDKIVSETIL